LTTEELDEPMATFWNMRVATLGARGVDQRHAAVVRVDSGAGLHRSGRSQSGASAAMFQGHATVLEDAGQEGVDEHLEEVCWLMGTKYPGGQGETRDRSAGRVVFEPSPLITWDNLKLPKG